MRSVLFSVFGFDIHSYGASKALAAIVAAYLLARAFETRRSQAGPGVLTGDVGNDPGGSSPRRSNTRSSSFPTSTCTTSAGGASPGRADSSAASLPPWSSCAATGSRLAGSAACSPVTAPMANRPPSPGRSFPNGVVPTDFPTHPTPLHATLAAVLTGVKLQHFLIIRILNGLGSTSRV